MQLEAKKLLEDIRQAAEGILEFTRDKTFENYDDDFMLANFNLKRNL